MVKYGKYDEIHSVSELLGRINASENLIEMGEV